MKHNKPEHSLNGATSAKLANDYAQRALRGAPPMTETEAQVLWAFCRKIAEDVRNAEHSAFMLLSDTMAINAPDDDFRQHCVKHLGEAAANMRCVKILLDGGIEALKQREGEAA